MDWKSKIEKLLDLLKQPSTIKGVIGLLGVFGLSLSPEKYADFVTGLGIIYFLIAIFWQDS